MIGKILKYLAVVVVVILGLASVLFTAPFSKTTLDINLGTVVVATVFLIYAIFTLYSSSILILVLSFLQFSRRIMWFLAFFTLGIFLLVLNNLIIFAGRGSDALPLFIPLGLYVIAAFRFFRRLSKGRK